MNKWVIGGIIIFLALVIYFGFNNSSFEITNFEDCIAAGNPAMESYPRQCIDPISGKNFVEEIPSWKTDDVNLMQHSIDRTYGCFGCSGPGAKTPRCVDPIAEMKLVNETENRYCNSDFEVVEAEEIENETNTVIEEEISWINDGNGWKSVGSPPSCPEPLVLDSPVDVSLATSILYPGQIRGTDYKPHGGFRFDDLDNGIEVRAVMDGYILKAARYETGDGEVQNFLFYVNECGIMMMNDHLLTLSPKLQEVFDKIPVGENGDSRTTFVEPRVYLEKGELLATEIGFKKNKNVFLDWGVYDLRETNGVEYDSDFRKSHPNIEEYGTYALCWLDMLSEEDASIVKALPGADGVNGKTSDYC